MTRKLSFTVSFFVALVVTLISFSANAQERTAFESGMCSDAVHEKCVSNAYNRFVEVHRDYKRWRKDLAACKFRYNAWQVKWQLYLNRWREKCEGNSLRLDCHGGPDEPEKADSGSRIGCLNTLARMDPSVIDRQYDEVWEAEREARRRQEAVTRLAVLGPNDVPQPTIRSEQKEEPKVHLSDAEATDMIARANALAAATNSVLSATPPHPVSSPTPPKAYDFQVERYNQWRTAHPGAVTANNPAKVTVPVNATGARIGCIPPNVSVVKIADNGDLALFIHAGADITALHRCLPNYDFDAVKVVSANIAAATIPYYLEHPDRPMYKNKFHFHQGRWRLKRSEWRASGKEFFADFFRENTGREFGFALQGGQRLELSAKAVAHEPSVAPPKTESNEPAKHGGYRRTPLNDEQSRVAGVGRTVSTDAWVEDANSSNLATSLQTLARVEMPYGLKKRAECRLANLASDRDLLRKNRITSAGRAYIRAGPRDARVMYIKETRYRRGDGTDLNLQENFVRYDAQENLPFREHYGQYAFG